MRALSVVLVLACGCTHAQAVRTHRVAEIATAGGLIGIMACGVSAALVPAHDSALLDLGLAFVPVSVLGALVYISTDSEANQPEQPPPSRRAHQREVAWELTKQAAEAARAHDCSQVQAIAPRVRDLDSELHVSVFLRDVAIQRCMRVDAN